MPPSDNRWRPKRALLILLFGLYLAHAAPASAAVREREIDYPSGNVVLKGSIAYDDSLSGRRPGVVPVIHEWSGLSEHARHNARRLAEAGYVALALDMYGAARQAHRPHEALTLSAEIRPASLGKRCKEP